ncbi:canalicular multispecific organic anion transporter 1 [Beauveria bassiana ARSEF 2860]|uniref:Canalicular multispecific organic anion transporter 1 n=1 Tax=Beauveria bassiana (strain ARSEF 2860) TaxID=655819 RepID=J4KMH3_BEAB2|nr:canalicular multispecific organic anion transporter 1 [Beauveria bassiana ARSEF 2860]EJP63954.1 canalicular multispecific organic anion transporter 1 [Beauveria bassiana ARSEF 2860]
MCLFPGCLNAPEFSDLHRPSSLSPCRFDHPRFFDASPQLRTRFSIKSSQYTDARVSSPPPLSHLHHLTSRSGAGAFCKEFFSLVSALKAFLLFRRPYLSSCGLTNTMLDKMDTHFGPADVGRFDFTILFEHTMLGLVPTGIIVLALPTRSSALVQARPGAALVAIQLASLILWYRAARTIVSLAAAIMSFAASVCVLAIIYITYIYAVQPSVSITEHLLAHHHALRYHDGPVLLYERRIGRHSCSMPKRNLLYSDKIRDNAGTEGFSGFWNRSMLIWVTRLVVKGSHQHLKVEDLPPIGQQDNPEQLYNRFTPFWDTLAAATISKWPLIRAGVRTLYWEFLNSILPRLCLVGFSFARPFLMQWTASAVVRFCSLKRMA